MAYLVRRPGGSFQIRECSRTEQGPRSKTLASFRGALSELVLDQASRKASEPLNRQALIDKARALGIPWESATLGAAHRLLRGLRRGRSLDPVLVGLLREGLSQLQAVDLSSELSEAVDWLGSSDEERGRTLPELLRLGDAIVQSRGGPSARPVEPYPRIDSKHRQAA